MNVYNSTYVCRNFSIEIVAQVNQKLQ